MAALHVATFTERELLVQHKIGSHLRLKFEDTEQHWAIKCVDADKHTETSFWTLSTEGAEHTRAKQRALRVSSTARKDI